VQLLRRVDREAAANIVLSVERQCGQEYVSFSRFVMIFNGIFKSDFVPKIMGICENLLVSSSGGISKADV
jgi:hypothetical protein